MLLLGSGIGSAKRFDTTYVCVLRAVFQTAKGRLTILVLPKNYITVFS